MALEIQIRLSTGAWHRAQASSFRTLERFRHANPDAVVQNIIMETAEAYIAIADQMFPHAVMAVHEPMRIQRYDDPLGWANWDDGVRTESWGTAARRHWQERNRMIRTDTGRDPFRTNPYSRPIPNPYAADVEREAMRRMEQTAWERYRQQGRQQNVWWIDDALRGLAAYRQPGLRGKEADSRGRRLLLENLTETQKQSLARNGYFEVRGHHTDRLYRIGFSGSMNIVCPEAAVHARLMCFVPDGGLVIGDTLLAQKLALETHEQEALRVANVFTLLPMQEQDCYFQWKERAQGWLRQS
jgi:hypothetical protein